MTSKSVPFLEKDYKPPKGWLEELFDAEEEAKRCGKDSAKQVASLCRLACALAVLRRWERCQKTVKKALKLKPGKKYKVKLKSLQQEVEKEMSKIKLGRFEQERVVERIRSVPFAMRNNIIIPHEVFKNSNLYLW